MAQAILAASVSGPLVSLPAIEGPVPSYACNSVTRVPVVVELGDEETAAVLSITGNMRR